MHPYSTLGWDNLFDAEAGAAATLTGLIFVAISINLSEVVRSSVLPSRAIESLCKLITVVIVAMVCLVPGLSPLALGATITVIGVMAWSIPVRLQWLQLRNPIPGWNWASHKEWIVTRAVVSQLATLPFIIGGVSLMLESGGGLYWLVAGAVLALLGGMFGAWILLIEIVR
jgi:hypothetical protein